MEGLSKKQLEQFHTQGMLCIPGFLSQAELSQALACSHELLEQLDVQKHPKTRFKTGDNDHVGDQYFFDSSDKVSYFFDVDAFDAEGNLRFPKEKAVNKIGHGLHLHVPVFRDITFKERVQAIARDLQYTDPRVLQSMLICKNPVGAESSARDNAVPPHTDGTFLYTEPQSAVGFWFALEDCTVANGCLSYLSGSHKTTTITKRFARIDGGQSGCNFIDVEVPPKAVDEGKDQGEYTIVECKAGSLILIHNSVLHKSEKNLLDKSRFAYAFHLIDGTAKYDELNWLQVPSTGGTNFLKLF